MEDAKIIALFWERNEQAVKEPDTAYGGKLYRLSNRILYNRVDAEEGGSDTARRPDSETVRRELRPILERFLESLRKESRLIFLRRYLYVDSVAEIAQRYGISESKVKTQLHRSRQKLHTCLEKEGITV